MTKEMRGCPTEIKDPAYSYIRTWSSDQEITFTEGNFDVADGGNDLNSLTGESFNRSGQLFKYIKPVDDEFAEDERPPKKRVRFASNACGKILCHEYKKVVARSPSRSKCPFSVSIPSTHKHARKTRTSGSNLAPKVLEYVLRPITGTLEFAVVSVTMDEFVDVTAEMMKDCSVAKHDKLVDCDTQSCSSDGEIMFTDDALELTDGGDDDHSLTGETYIRSGQHSGHFEPEMGELGQDEGTNKKRVRFASDANGKILCQIQNNCNSIRKLDRKLIWFKRDDFRRFRKEGRKERVEARKSSFVKNFLKVYDACKSSEKLRSLEEKHYTAVSESKYRGYEAAIFYNILHRERTVFMKQVLEMQQQHVSCSIMTIEERAEELGNKSRTLSKTSRRLAHVVGTGDSVVAKKKVSDKGLEKMAKLGNMSRTLTKVSRRLAYLLGSGDSVVARKMVSQKELKSMVKDCHKEWKPPTEKLSDFMDNLFEV